MRDLLATRCAGVAIVVLLWLVVAVGAAVPALALESGAAELVGGYHYDATPLGYDRGTSLVPAPVADDGSVGTVEGRAADASGPSLASSRGLDAPGSIADDVPAVVFSRSRAPGIAQNFDDAVATGAPTRLTRVNAATRDANRRAALRGQSPAPAGQSLDEYPFACSAQGGCGAFVRSVPIGEQGYQGGVLSRFFQDYGVNPGDPFDVLFGP